MERMFHMAAAMEEDRNRNGRKAHHFRHRDDAKNIAPVFAGALLDDIAYGGHLALELRKGGPKSGHQGNGFGMALVHPIDDRFSHLDILFKWCADPIQRATDVIRTGFELVFPDHLTEVADVL
jgi:hypothetical protein